MNMWSRMINVSLLSEKINEIFNFPYRCFMKYCVLRMGSGFFLFQICLPNHAFNKSLTNFPSCGNTGEDFVIVMNFNFSLCGN